MVLSATVALLVAAAGCGGDGGPACSECGPPRIAVGDGAVWVAQGRDLHRLDPGTGEITRTMTVLPERRSRDLEAIDAHGGLVAVATGRAAIVVDRDGAEAARVALPVRAYAPRIVLAGPRVLVAGGGRLTVATGRQVTAESPRLPARVTGMAVDGGTAWVGGPGYVWPLDVTTAAHAGALSTVTAGPGGLAAADGVVWAADGEGLVRIDPATGRAAVRVNEPADLVALGDGALWTLTFDGDLHRRDPDTGRALDGPFDVGDEPHPLLAGGGAVYVGLRHPAVARVHPATGVPSAAPRR